MAKIGFLKICFGSTTHRRQLKYIMMQLKATMKKFKFTKKFARQISGVSENQKVFLRIFKHKSMKYLLYNKN